MKKRVYLCGLLLAVLGFAMSLAVFIATLRGADPSESMPWLWKTHPLALLTWGIMFLTPGLFALRDRPAEEEHEAPPPPHDLRARALARALNIVLLAVALANFGFVLHARTDTATPANAEERAQAYRVSRQYTLRTYSGFWLVLYGVPLGGFCVLLREP